MNESLEEKIKEIDKVAQLIPAVVIIHELENMILRYMSPRGLSILKTTKKEIIGLSGPEYYNRYFNSADAADYAPKIVDLIERGNEEEEVCFFQQVRASEQDDFKWYLSTTKIFMKDKSNRPTHIITYACPIDPAHHITSKVNRLLEENNFLRHNHQLFSELTKREKEILKCMALGENSEQIADELHISEKTVNTHRRNIRTKLKINTNYDLVRFAQAFDLI